MTRTSLSLSLLLAASAGAAPSVVGDVVVVPDPTGDSFDVTKHPGSIDLAVCALGAQGLYQVKPDAYDAVFAFTTKQMTGLLAFATTPSGNPVRQTDQGVAYGNSFLFRQPPSAYGSPATLKHCVYAGPLSQWPANPDDPFQVQSSPLGGESPTGVSSVGVLGHELGHHWLVYAAYDLNDGTGPHALFRGNTREDTEHSDVTTSTLHWSAYADTHSVMYGNAITDHHDGTFTLASEDHKYGDFDQYLMGLRAAADVSPLLVVDDGSGLGYADFPLPLGQTQTIDGSAVTVTVDDVVRAIGPRNPAWPNAQHCFRAAFVLVTEPGHTATAQEIALVDAYRQRFASWFGWATDGRGTMGTQLDVAPTCPAPGSADDAGTPAADGGTDEIDGGEAADAGAPDAGPGETFTPPAQSGPPPELVPTHRLKPGCGCGSAPLSSLGFALLIWIAAWSGLRRWL